MIGSSSFVSPLSVDACVARIRARNDALNAVLHVVDAPRSSVVVSAHEGGALAPLAGVPYVLKDTWDTAGIPTTGGSHRHRERVPPVSGRVHRAFVESGAVLLGKSNLCDLAFSAESDNHLRGPVRHPLDPSRSAGGSTGGGAAAVADGMAVFDWGTDFGGSIRGPAAFCGIVGLRLSHAVWPVGAEHFPRLPSFFWDFCGMGPLARDVATVKAIVDAVAPALRLDHEPAASGAAVTERQGRRFGGRRVVVLGPDRAHRGDWPAFDADVARLLDRADVVHGPAQGLPTISAINALYTGYLAAHFDAFMGKGELPFGEALAAVVLGLASGGRLDKRIHPNTGILLAAVAALGLRYGDQGRARVARQRADLVDAVGTIWARGDLLVTPTTTQIPPRHGRSAFATSLMSFCKLGNLVDATAVAIPFGHFTTKRTPTPFARSLQILGPPGSEAAVLELAEHLAHFIN